MMVLAHAPSSYWIVDLSLLVALEASVVASSGELI